MQQSPRYIRLDDETQAFFSLAKYHALQRARGNEDVEVVQEDTDWAAIQQLLQSEMAIRHLEFVREMSIR